MTGYAGRCVQCGAPAQHSCSLLVRSRQLVTPAEIRPGDWLYRSATGRRVLVSNVTLQFAVDEEPYWRIETERDGAFNVLYGQLPVLIIRREPCAVPICEDCGAERGPNSHVCPDHWKAVQDVEPDTYEEWKALRLAGVSAR